MLLGPVLLFKPFFHVNRALAVIGRWLWAGYLATLLSSAFFVEASTLPFIHEYDSRPNFVFVEYLIYPKEVFATLIGSHLIELIVFSIITGAIFWATARWIAADPSARLRLNWGACLLAFPLVDVGGVRGR